MHECVVDMVVIPVRVQLNVESEKRFDRPAKPGTSRVKEETQRKRKEQRKQRLLRENGDVDRTINLSVSEGEL